MPITTLIPFPRTRLRGHFSATVTAERFVLAGFVLLHIAAAVYLLRFQVNLPWQDEWDVAETFLAHGYTWEWIADRHNEHRFLVGRALWGLAMLVTGWDFRAGGWLTLTLLATTAFGLLRAAKQVRGRYSFADVLVPVLLLSTGHCFNLLMGYQIVFAAVVVCGGGLIATAMTAYESRTGMLAGLWLLLMAGNGGFGLAFTPPVALWLLYLAGRRFCVLQAGVAVVALGYAAWSLLHLPSTAAAHEGLKFGSVLAVAVGYLTAGLGAVLTDVGLVQSGMLPVISTCVLGVYFLAVARLCWVDYHEPAERSRAFGLLAILCGQFAVALGIGLSREAAITERYVTPSVVGLLACWAVGVLYGPRGSLGTIVAVIAAVAIALANASPSRHYAVLGLMRGTLHELETDLRAGMPPTFLAGKYGHAFGMLVGDRAESQIQKFSAAKLGPFQHASPDPAKRSVPAELKSSTLSLSPPAGRVHGFRIAFDQQADGVYCTFVLHWRDTTGTPRQAHAYGPYRHAHGHVAFWIDGTPTDIHLEVPPSVAIRYAEWLVPAE